MRRNDAVVAVMAALALATPTPAQERPEYPSSFSEPVRLISEALGPFSRHASDVPEAQAYFDQGLQLLYAFAPASAARSFHEASRLDPTCAMCWFGEAWAWGPYLNGPMGPDDAPRAHFAIRQALRVAAAHGAADVERSLMEAMAVRYEPEHDPETRRTLDERYAEAMGRVYEQFPEDQEVGTLYGEALMLLQPRRGRWDIEDPAVGRIHQVLAATLSSDITHPGACHLYVHATEPTTEPGRAEACAEYLGSSIPGASHIQHMPSHTYNRIGRWGDAVRANIAAWHSDLKAREGKGFAIYPSHNLHMLLFAASFDGQGGVATQAGKDYGRLMDGGQFYHVLTLLRFGRFDEILGLRTPPDGAIFRGLWDFGRGYAHLRAGDDILARAYLEKVRRGSTEDDAFRGHSAGQLLGVVGGILEGEILRADGDLDGAISILRHAVELEDGLRCDEPEPLPFTARHWLGAVLLEAERAVDAESIYRASLEDHPHNGWSLFGLEEALRAQGRGAEADAVHADFEHAWARADHWIQSSRY
jgi:tetratricopeptide (TPR) repeat protein